MTEESKELDIVVVTGSNEKKLGEEVTTVEVLKADVIQQDNSKFDEAMNKVPGVNMMGRSISIRGGSGYADATSNRVLALQDGLPIISPENGGIIWDMVPIEELEQVEIIKGSASSLFGSSALDGVLNLVTVNPEPVMEDKIILSYGFYGQPDNREWDWWWRHTVINGKGEQVVKTQPRMFGGGSFLHRKQYGDFGVVLSGAYQQDQSYLQDNDYNYARLGAKLRYSPHKNRHVTMGINANFFYKKYHDFFLAKDIDSGMYQTASASAIVEQRTFNIDP
jgi:outer membrane receptor protein involved in Fe transport